MAWGDLVQHKSSYCGTGGQAETTITVTLDSTPTEGNLLVMTSYCGNGDLTAPSGWSVAHWLIQPVNDDGGGTFYKIAGASESTTITSPEAASANEHVFTVAEYEGPWDASPLDQETHNSYTIGNTPRTLTTGTLSQADNLIIGCAVGRLNANEPPTYGGNTDGDGANFSGGFSNVDGVWASSFKFEHQDYKTVSATTAVSSEWDTVDSNYNGGNIEGLAVFMKGDTGGGGGRSIPVAMRHYRNMRT
jgi:hypothetical protein